jgi:hypothetical protein
MDSPDLVEKYEMELWNTVRKMHKDGIPYDTTHYILHEMTKSLGLMEYCENWLNQHISP